MVDLSPLNTLNVSATANSLLEIKEISDLKKLNQSQPFLLLGHGSNILFTKDFPGTIVKINLKGRQVVSQNDTEVVIEVAAGENWHDLVTWTVDQGWSGLENMALIPGTVGAAVVGNIGAYGGNQQDLLVSITAIELSTGKLIRFNKTDCDFAYRESRFKHNQEYLITSVTYRLSKIPHLETTYHATRHASLLPTLQQIAKEPYTIKDVYRSIVKLRSEKLPDWHKIGTAGSFFKNPVITKSKFDQLSKEVPDLLAYPVDKLQYTNPVDQDQYVKLSLGRVLDELGWKGRTIGRVSTSPNHSMYVVNLGGATGAEIFAYAEAMRTDVQDRFDINLEYEVQII